MTNRCQSLGLLGGLVLFCVSATDVLGGGAVTPFTTVVDKSTRTVFKNTIDTFSALAGYVLITVASCTQVNGSASFYECNVYGSSAPTNAVNPSNITASLLGNIVSPGSWRNIALVGGVGPVGCWRTGFEGDLRSGCP